MNAVQSLSDEQFEQYALSIIQRELGLDGLARFLRLNRSGPGNYTDDRHGWLRDLTVAGIKQKLNH